MYFLLKGVKITPPFFALNSNIDDMVFCKSYLTASIIVPECDFGCSSIIFLSKLETSKMFGTWYVDELRTHALFITSILCYETDMDDKSYRKDLCVLQLLLVIKFF